MRLFEIKNGPAKRARTMQAIKWLIGGDFFAWNLVAKKVWVM